MSWSPLMLSLCVLLLAAGRSHTVAAQVKVEEAPLPPGWKDDVLADGTRYYFREDDPAQVSLNRPTSTAAAEDGTPAKKLPPQEKAAQDPHTPPKKEPPKQPPPPPPPRPPPPPEQPKQPQQPQDLTPPPAKQQPQPRPPPPPPKSITSSKRPVALHHQPVYDAAPQDDAPAVYSIVTQSCPKTVYVGGSAEGRRRCAKKIRKAIREGADINELGPSGQTALMAAVLQDKPLAVEALIELGADLEIRETDLCPGCSPMDGAANMGNVELVTILLAAGAKTSELATDGYAPIHSVSLPFLWLSTSSEIVAYMLIFLEALPTVAECCPATVAAFPRH